MNDLQQFYEAMPKFFNLVQKNAYVSQIFLWIYLIVWTL